MSENISIKVDGTATTVSVDRLKTNAEGGGTVEWMPESEMKEAASLRVWRNGEYAASSFGVDGFDVVEVAINGRGGAGAELTSAPRKLPVEGATPVIAEGGRGYAMGGAQRVEVEKSGGGTLTLVPVVSNVMNKLTATAQGKYRAANSGLYAYDSVDADVPERGSGGSGDEGWDNPYNPNNLPNAIVASPFKISYVDGEPIVFQYGDVRAFVATENPYGHTDYTVWSHPSYPNGMIPINEISFSPAKAAYDESQAIYSDGHGVTAGLFTISTYTDGGVGQPTPRSDNPIGLFNDPNHTSYDGFEYFFTNVSHGSVLLTKYNGHLYEKLDGYATQCGYIYKVRYSQTAFYYFGSNFVSPQSSEVFVRADNEGYGAHEFVPESTADPTTAGELIKLPSTMTVTVTWQRPYDGLTLTGTCVVFVDAEGSGDDNGEIVGEGGTGYN